jgi:hypothetical protein
MFTKYIKSKPAYFTVVYEAYRADGFNQAIAASKIALERNPGDEDMKREAVYLEDLANTRIKLQAEKEERERQDKKSNKGVQDTLEKLKKESDVPKVIHLETRWHAAGN